MSSHSSGIEEIKLKNKDETNKSDVHTKTTLKGVNTAIATKLKEYRTSIAVSFEPGERRQKRRRRQTKEELQDKGSRGKYNQDTVSGEEYMPGQFNSIYFLKNYQIMLLVL